MSLKMQMLPNAQGLPEGAAISLVGSVSGVPASDALTLKWRVPRAYIGTIGMVLGFVVGLAAAIALVMFLDSAFGIDFFTVRKGPVAMGMMCLLIAVGSGMGANWLVDLFTAKRKEVRVAWTDVRINNDGAIALLLWDEGRKAAVAQLTSPVATALREAQNKALGR